ncbi:hypothetical protein ACSQ67_024400 [Phaseolus vulgaris]
MADARVGFCDNKRVEGESARARMEGESARLYLASISLFFRCATAAQSSSGMPPSHCCSGRLLSVLAFCVASLGPPRRVPSSSASRLQPFRVVFVALSRRP